jgi:hypothetical protein
MKNILACAIMLLVASCPAYGTTESMIERVKSSIYDAIAYEWECRRPIYYRGKRSIYYTDPLEIVGIETDLSVAQEIDAAISHCLRAMASDLHLEDEWKEQIIPYEGQQKASKKILSALVQKRLDFSNPEESIIKQLEPCLPYLAEKTATAFSALKKQLIINPRELIHELPKEERNSIKAFYKALQIRRNPLILLTIPEPILIQPTLAPLPPELTDTILTKYFKLERNDLCNKIETTPH